MTNDRRLLRSQKALIGGVCAGVADYFSVDPVVVRIIAVAFTFASAGLLGIAYIALWVILPLEPKEVAPLDVEPQSVHSETYGSVDVRTSRKPEQGTPGSASPAQAASWRYTHPSYTSSAHVPPPPPAGASHAQPTSFTDSQKADQAPFVSPTPPCEGWVSAPTPPQRSTAEPLRSGVKLAVFAGSFLLFFGVSASVASMVEDMVWWQYWPLVFVILGMVRMVVPGEEGCRMRKFVDGLMVFSAGAALLMMSLGVVGWQTIELMLVSLWPLLLIVVGLLLLGGALKSPSLTLLAGVCFVAFCVMGLVWYSAPGATDEIVFSAPYGREYHLDVQPWDGSEAGSIASIATIA